MVEIRPSILGVEPKKLRESLDLLGNRIKEVHVDVMDGVFVKNNTLTEFHPRRIEWIKKDLNIHLMVQKPEDYFNKYWRAKKITFHLEVEGIKEKVKLVKQKKGLAINPETSIEKAYRYLEDFDEFLIMSVHPGQGGQKFIDSTIEKIKKLRGETEKTISVDGGVNKENAKKIVEAGADALVVGTALFEGNILQNFEEIEKNVGS